MTENTQVTELAMPPAYEPYTINANADVPAASPLSAALGLLRGRYHWAIGLGSVFAAVGLVTGYSLTRLTYRSVALIDIAPKVPKILTDTDEKGLLPMFEAYASQQAQLISTRRVVDQALASPEWRAVGPSGTDEAVGEFLTGLAITHPRNTQIVEVAFTHQDPHIAMVAVNQLVTSYMKVVAENKNAGGVELQGILENQLSSINSKLKDLRADVLAVTEDLGEAALDGKYANQIGELGKIEALLHDLDVEIATAKVASEKAAGAPERVRTPQEIALSNPGMESLLGRRAEAVARVEFLENREGLGSKNPDLTAAKDAVTFLDRQISDRAEAIRNASENAPDVREATRRENQKKRALLIELRDGIQEDIRRLGPKRLAVANIAAEQVILEEKRLQIKQRIEQINLESEGKDRITVMSWGERAVAPETDRRIAVALLSAAGGMGIGFGLVMLWGLREAKLRHVVDVDCASVAGRFLGVVPQVPDGGSAGDDATDDAAGLSDYCIHHIRTMLQLRSPDHRSVVALTSPSPGAGKTTLGLALGMSFATSGSRTLLIDCDFVGHGLTSAMRSIACDAASRELALPVADASAPVAARAGVPGGLMAGLLASKRLAFDESQFAELLAASRERAARGDATCARTAGILEALAPPSGRNGNRERRGVLGALDGRPLAECVIETECANLSVLPAGDAEARDAECLSRAGLEQLVEACRGRFDTVLIDTGPVLGSIEAAFATAAADSVLLVVSRGERRPPVEDALARIERFGAEVAGVVFNRATTADVAHSSYASRSKSRVSEDA